MHGGPVTAAVVALGTSLVGFASALGGAVLGAATTTDIGPWAQVGGTATAVGALAYVAKLLADGKLVAQPVAELLRQAGEREKRLEELVEDGKGREDSLRIMLVQREQHR
jgi:hypothetical protein